MFKKKTRGSLMPNNYKLGEDSNLKVENAIIEFKKTMETDNASGFINALKANKITVVMNYNLSKISPELISVINFGPTDNPKSSTVFVNKDIMDVNDFDIFFYLAHEVGHHIMHYKSGGETPEYMSREKNYRERFKKLPVEEQEADVFAYNLLMPETKFRSVYSVFNKIYNGNKDKIINNLSAYFFAGKEFVLQRLDFLGIE